jgi:hypothetical protein
MLRGMTARQFAGWWCYAQVEPFGAVREDFRAAQVGTMIVNNIPFRGRGAKAFRPDDVFQTLRKRKGQSVAQMAEAAMLIVKAYGGEVIQVGQGEGGSANG